LEPMETDIGIVIEIDIDLEIDIIIKYLTTKKIYNIFIYISIYLYTYS